MNASNGRTTFQVYFWPLRFLSIRFNGKGQWMFWAPLGVGVGVGVLFWLLPKANLVEEKGLLDISSGLLSMLVGFFVAALGVVLAFPSPRLDVPGTELDNPPRINNVPMSLRQFAISITAYLVFITLWTYIVAIIALVLQPAATWSASFDNDWLGHWSADDTHRLARAVGATAYSFLFGHIVSVTLFALFLVAGKLPETQSAPELKGPKRRDKAAAPKASPGAPADVAAKGDDA